MPSQCRVRPARLPDLRAGTEEPRVGPHLRPCWPSPRLSDARDDLGRLKMERTTRPTYSGRLQPRTLRRPRKLPPAAWGIRIVTSCLVVPPARASPRSGTNGKWRGWLGALLEEAVWKADVRSVLGRG